ncbi:hypothetical protein BDZ89DRAFT_1151294 [Hymenopellis radicata]|nr:hypothetical protein BDZ89DRAFT_1151294 [Hymenopellis radicata]
MSVGIRLYVPQPTEDIEAGEKQSADDEDSPLVRLDRRIGHPRVLAHRAEEPHWLITDRDAALSNTLSTSASQTLTTSPSSTPSLASKSDVQGSVDVEVDYLRDIAELKNGVTAIVIAVPGWYTDIQRRAVIDAASIAGLAVYRLINDTTAAALG